MSTSISSIDMSVSMRMMMDQIIIHNMWNESDDRQTELISTAVLERITPLIPDL